MLIEPTPVVEQIIGCAIRVHRKLGPGLLESAYEACLDHEFAHHSIAFERQVAVPLVEAGRTLKAAYRADFLVESIVVVDVKAVQALGPIHTAQMLTYLKLLQRRQGLLLNFNVRLLKHGIRRVLL